MIERDAMNLKRILALIMAFLCLFAFVACDVKEKETLESESESFSKEASESSATQKLSDPKDNLKLSADG